MTRAHVQPFNTLSYPRHSNVEKERKTLLVVVVVVVHHILYVCPFYSVFFMNGFCSFSVYYNFFERRRTSVKSFDVCVCVRARFCNNIFCRLFFFCSTFQFDCFIRTFLSPSFPFSRSLIPCRSCTHNMFILSLLFIWTSSFPQLLFFFLTRGICESHSNYVYK